jgi:hypothetical protein
MDETCEAGVDIVSYDHAPPLHHAEPTVVWIGTMEE